MILTKECHKCKIECYYGSVASSNGFTFIPEGGCDSEILLKTGHYPYDSPSILSKL